MNLSALTGVGDNTSGRFFFVNYLPVYGALLFLLTLLWGGAPGDVDFARAWQTAAGLGAGEIVELGVALLLAAVILQPWQLPLVRMLEGYWPSWAEPAAGVLRSRQARRRKRLEQAATVPGEDDPVSDEVVVAAGMAGAQLAERFPSGPFVRPTALGNALTAAEQRAGARYGWDAVVAWPRLYPVLGDQVRAMVDDRRNSIDSAARLAAVGAATAVAAAGLLAASGWWVLLALAPLAVAIVGYGGAVAAAIAYGASLEVAFDLHRFDMLSALRLPLPADITAEREQADSLCTLWRQDAPVILGYAHPPANGSHQSAV